MTLPVNGDVFDADTLNSALQGPALLLNDIKTTAVPDGSLHRNQLPDLFDGLFPNGFTALERGETYETYDNSFSAATVPTINLDEFSTTAPNAPYGPTAVFANDGWRIPARANVTADAAEVAFSASAASFTDTRLSGVLVQGTVELGEALPQSSDFNDCIWLGIGWKDGTGTRHVVERSIAFFSKRCVWYSPISTMTFITQEDLDLGDGEVVSFFLVCASRYVENNSNATRAYDIGSFHISCMPFHAGELS